MTKTITQSRFRNYAGLILLVFLSFSGLKGIAQPLLVENFEYSVGSLLTDNGWTAHSGAGTEAIDVTNGLIFSGYAGSSIGGAANLDNNGEDVNKVFTELTSGTVYAAFVVQTQATNAGGYFIHFGQSTIATTYFTRIYLSATGDGIGLGLGNTPPATYSPITPGVPALVVIKLDIDTKVSSIYVFSSFPATEPVTPDGTVTETASFTNVGSIALRQYNASERVVVDGIRVADNWADAVAPSSGSTPVISASPGTLSGFVYSIGNGPSASQSYNITGADLTPASGNITVTASANYEISLNNSTFVQTPLSVPYTGGALGSTPVYVRLKAGLAAGEYNGELIANAGGGATTTNVICNGVVEAPASTTLPYDEDFSGGFGLCYTYSVSGPAQYWKHSTSGEYAYMNGYNTGLLEEDWMILPAVNFNNYSNVSMTFESYMNYGSDDADNYFKLVYSTNYAGIGDPTLATWTELSFNYPTDLSTWTPSGTVDLSAITGASVYIAFKYHYNPTFYRSWQIDNISIVSGITPALSATPSSLSGFTYVTGSGPSAVQSYQLSGSNLVGSGNITVTAPANYEISTNGTTFSTSLSLPFGSSVITGQPVTISVRLKAGLAIGNYNAEAITHSGGGAANLTVNCSGSVTGLVPSITAETLPQWIQGINGSNGKRVPFAYRVSIGNLMPSATYRYYNKVVIGTDNATTDGAGNSIFVAGPGSFTRTSSTSMGTPGEYSEFTTDASGNYTGWFMTEPTGNARFTPGNAVFMRIMLNDGNGGASVATRLTTTTSANVINFGTENVATEGTGIRGISEAMAGNIVYLYDNTAGTGRPIYGSSIETTGIDFNAIGSYATFYSTDVQGNDGSWGGIVPNVLPDGIRRIEERSNADGSIVAVHTSDNGVWGVYDTRNPFGGDTDILIIDLMPAGNPVLTVTPSVLNGFTYLEGSGPSSAQTYQLSGSDLQGSGIVTVTAPADYEISADGVNYMLTLNYDITDGEITGQPVTVSVRLKAGLAADDYNGEAIVNSGGGATDKMVTCNGSVTSGSAPALANVTLPLWIQGINGTNAERVPFAFKAKLINLTPSATYRYFNKVVVGTDTPTTDGAGNAVFVAADGTFTRTSSTSLANPGEYGEFTTDAEGTYFGWFITEPTGNARFTPGNQLFMRISINDGADGTTVDNRLTTVNYTTVLQFGTEAIATHGTAIRGISDDDPKDFVFLYDNVAGTGRPLYATQIETTGVDFCATTVYAPFYCEDVAGWDGEWGGIVPNINAAGLQRVEVRSFTDGTIVNSYNMASGIWIATDTHNPTGGVTDVLVIDLTGIGVVNPETAQQNVFSSGREIKVLSPVATEITFSLYNMSGQLVYSRNLKGSNEYLLQTAIPAGVYIARVVGNNSVTGNKLIIR